MRKFLVAVSLGLVLLPVAVGAVGEEEEVDGLRVQRAKLMMERKEERQADRISRLAGRISELNKKRVAAMNRHLERMRMLMTKVKVARDKAAGAGKDVTQVNSAITAADAAIAAGMQVNAGHDLNLDNLAQFIQAIPECAEVSIGHAITSDALDMGWDETIRRYLEAVRT